MDEPIGFILREPINEVIIHEEISNEGLFKSISFSVWHGFEYDCRERHDIWDVYEVTFNFGVNEVVSQELGMSRPLTLDDSVLVNFDLDYQNEMLLYFYRPCAMDSAFNASVCEENKDAIYGLKLNQFNKVYFGWIRLQMNDNRFKLVEYAYNTIPNEPIKAGQKE